MKVSEALAERSDLDKKIRVTVGRAQNMARFVEGEDVPEQASELLAEARTLLARKYELVRRINMTNAQTQILGGEMTVTAAIARRDHLNAERKIITEVIDRATPGFDAYGLRGRRRTELPEKTDLPVRDLRAEADRLSRDYRELDTSIQQSNWETELV